MLCMNLKKMQIMKMILKKLSRQVVLQQTSKRSNMRLRKKE